MKSYENIMKSYHIWWNVLKKQCKIVVGVEEIYNKHMIFDNKHMKYDKSKRTETMGDKNDHYRL